MNYKKEHEALLFKYNKLLAEYLKREKRVLFIKKIIAFIIISPLLPIFLLVWAAGIAIESLEL